jgi:CRP-like cAMP-binding protein
LAFFSFVNFDVLGLLGLDCVGNLDYRARVALSCMLPVLIVGASIVVFAKQKIKHLAKGLRTASHKEREEAISSLFDLVDADSSGNIEPNEFKTMLRELNHKRLDMSHVKQMMGHIVGGDRDAKEQIRLSRQQFIDAAMAGEIANTNADQWVEYVRVNRERSQIFSTAFQLLGLIHAPVSSKLFNYFDCHNISGRSFLREDYSLECDTGRHETFKIVVYMFLIGFTFGLPLGLGVILVRNRKTLRTPKVMEKYGFLYNTYIPGAEYWDIHELMRRLLLTGMLLLLPPTTRLAASLLVSIVACCSLFGVKPHTAHVIQRLEQSSFVILPFKYVGGVLLMVDMTTADRDFLGTMFVLLDVIYILHSLICLVSVAHVVWNAAANTTQVNQENTTTRGVSVHPVTLHHDLKTSNQLKKEIAALRLRKNIHKTLQNINEKVRTSDADRNLKKVKEIQKKHQNHRNVAVENIKKRQSNSRTSLELRVQARKKVKHSNALLKSVYFSNVDPTSISKIIDEMDFIAIRDNNCEMCRQGDNADIFYIIVSGTCQVTIDGKPVALLGEMDIFGENALFTEAKGRSRRGATVTTINNEIETVQVLALPRKKFNQLLASGILNEDCVGKLKLVAETRKKENEQKKVGNQMEEMEVQVGETKT